MTGQPEGFEYKADFLALSQQVALLQELRGLHYEHEMFHGRLMKRAWAQFGYRYAAAAHKVTPAPAMPAYLQTILQNATLTFRYLAQAEYVRSFLPRHETVSAAQTS